MFVETLLGIFILSFSHFLNNKQNKNFTSSSLSFLCDCSANRLSSLGSSDYIPLRRSEIRSILGDDYPLSSVQIEGAKFVLRTRRFSLGSDLFSAF